MNILDLHTLALDLVAKDFSDGHAPHNGGPTKTARALAIIHLAARDAYAMVTDLRHYKPIFRGSLPDRPEGVGSTEADGISAALGAGTRVCKLLYRDLSSFISDRTYFGADANPKAIEYGREIAERWVASRHNDNSSLPQLDSRYCNEPGRHRPDPISKAQTMGRTWGQVTPFILADVEMDAPLDRPPPLKSQDYADAYDDVFINGRDDIAQRDPEFQQHAAIGIFWGYDGANKLGTPPRLYNQVVVKCEEFKRLSPADQINVLAAINAAMADAGIAAWYWKYFYDLWRPVLAIREAEQGFGPTGHGDGNPYRNYRGDPFWKPLGAPRSNPIPPLKAGCDGDNFTPNFPAYPSGHATFGCACFETFAKLMGKQTKDIQVTFMSDEFNGVTTDNTGAVRPAWTQTFTLECAIQQNNESRIYLGVHWSFDASGGEALGKLIAAKAYDAFRPMPQ